MYEHLNDQQLLPLARRDHRAYEALMRRHLPRMHAVACGIVGESNAEDVLQEVLWSTYRNLKNFRGDAEFSTWVYRITMNACYQALRKPQADITPLDDLDPASPQNVAANAEHQQIRDLIREGLQSLPAEQREAFSLREFLDMEYQQIADVLGVQLGTVKSRINRAKQALKQFLLQRGVKP